MMLPAFMIQEGDMIDLEADPYADPAHDNVALQCEFATVAHPVSEGVYPDGRHWIDIGFEGFDVIRFPRDHVLNVVRVLD